PVADQVRGRIVGETLRPTSLHGYDEDIVASVAVGAKGDLGTVWAEDRAIVVGFVHRDGTGDAARRFHHPEVAQVAERHKPTIGRDIRRAGEANGFLGVAARSEQAGHEARKEEMAKARHGVNPGATGIEPTAWEDTESQRTNGMPKDLPILTKEET